MARGNPHPKPSPATQFKPGIDWTGNAGGRPKGESFTSILREALESKHKRDPSWRHNLVAVALERAAMGDLDALKWIAEKTEGKVKDVVETTGEVTIRVVRDRATGAAPLRPPPDPGADTGGG